MTDPVMADFVARLPDIHARHGPTPFAFSFAQPFGPDGSPVAREDAPKDDTCPAT